MALYGKYCGPYVNLHLRSLNKGLKILSLTIGAISVRFNLVTDRYNYLVVAIKMCYLLMLLFNAALL